MTRDRPPASRATALRALAYLWAAPCTAVGLLAAAVACLWGARARVVEGVLEVALGAAPHRPRLPFQAITLGHVVVGVDAEVLARVRAHEQVHVRQYERWGLLFFLAYPAASLHAWLRGGDAYRDNAFEREARAKGGPD